MLNYLQQMSLLSFTTRMLKQASRFLTIIILTFIFVSTPPPTIISPVARAISECDKFAVDKGSLLTDNEFCEPCEGPGDAPASLTLREKLALLVFARANTVDEIKDASSSKVGGIFVRPSDRNDEATYNGISESLDGLQPLVAVDYEGGRVQAPGPGITGVLQSARELGTKTEAQIKDIAKNKGAKLKSYGINMDFAPVLDIGGTNNAVIGDRAFANDAATVTSKAEAFTEGLRESGIISTIKHFPGHGSTEGNSHDQPVRTRSLADLEARDIKPFRKLSGNPKTAIMTGHLVVPEWGSQATSLNPKTYEYIRGELSFDGVVVTDALDMEGITSPGDQPSRALVAIQAGADMALITSTGQIGPTLDKLEQAVTAGGLTEERVDESVGRINTLRGVDSATPSAGSPTDISSGSVQELAQQMLDNPNISYYTNREGINTRDVVLALSQGQKAYTTASNAPNREVDINSNILRFILEAAQSGGIMVNALTDKTHSNGSNHYDGLAVDLDNNGSNSPPTSVLDPIATKYGGSRNGETSHWHYDFTENVDVAPAAAPITGASCCPAGGGTGTLTGANPEEKVFNYLSSGKGIDTVQAAGIMGNMVAESGYNPTALNDGSGAFGIVQWTQGRKAALQAAATAAGVDINKSVDKGNTVEEEDANILFQLDFMVAESKARSSVTFENTTEWDGLAQTTSVEPGNLDPTVNATIYWEVNFERSGGQANSTRLSAALDVFTRLGGGGGGGGAAPSTDCPGSGEGGTVEGFPLSTTKQVIDQGVEGAVWCYLADQTCEHHDYDAADIHVPTGTQVVSAQAGKVVNISDRAGSTNGSGIVILGTDNFVYYYTHMLQGSLTVEDEQEVTMGQEIGVVGVNVGEAKPHLHFDMQPPPATNRPGCSRAECSGYTWVDVQPLLYPLYERLP